ncbi:FXL17 protein, partial [Steatornis caripensis]|nr:FXL17 protein [Steatornis caripensis]
MGHLLSKEASSLSRDRRCRRGRKVQPRSRSCFLRGPCMLCFIVHSASPPAPEQPLPAGDPLLPPSPYAALATAEQRAARRLLRLPRAAWEPRGRCQRLLLSGLLPSPVRGLLGPAGPPGEVASEMFSKLCSVYQQICACCNFAAIYFWKAEINFPATSLQGCCLIKKINWYKMVCRPSELSNAYSDTSGCLLSRINRNCACRTRKGRSLLRLVLLNPLLEYCIWLWIFSNLSLNERCLSASLVCKYWRDLCLDFQFWKQLDLSSRQQVTDELLEKIASRSQNITEINISDCRNVSDTGVCILAIKCPGLLRYTAYRCKQLSDTSIIAVASQCPLLQKVHVGNQDRLTDEGLKQLGSKCRELKDIHFGQCYKISDEGMIIIAKGCLKLQRIYMQENKLVTDQSVKAFAEHCPELQYVGFMGCSVTSKGVIHLTNV